MRRTLVFLSALTSLAGCSNSSTEFWLQKPDLLPMVALDDRVAFVDRVSATAFVLDPGDPSLVPQRVPVGTAPVSAAKHTGSNRLLVVSGGSRGSAAKAAVAPQLTVLDPTGAPPASLDLDSRFDGLAQSQEGRYAILYHTSSSQDGNGGTLFNPNDLVVVDFGATPTGAPTSTPRSIRSLGGVPSSIRFSPEYPFPTLGARRMAVVLSQSYVTLLDLYDLTRSEISIPLCAVTSACSYVVDDVVFDPSNLAIYVRVDGASDVFAIALSETGSGGYQASLSMLAVGATASDMALYRTGKDARLAVLAPDAKRLVIIEPSTGSSTTVSMAIPANKIVPFTTPSTDPTDPRPRDRGMLVDLVHGSNSVLFADFEQVESAGSIGLAQYSIRGSATDVVSLNAPGMAMLMFGKSMGNAVLSVVKLGTQSFFDFNSSSALGTPYLDSVGNRLWSVDSPDQGASSSGVHYLDIGSTSTQAPPTVWLDQTIVGITALAKPNGADQVRYLVLAHPDPNDFGNLTFVDADNPKRATARTAYGFLLSSYLERSQP